MAFIFNALWLAFSGCIALIDGYKFIPERPMGEKEIQPFFGIGITVFFYNIFNILHFFSLKRAFQRL
jgi:hypothetical protein